MAKYYVTLGQSHQHMIDHNIWDKDGVLEIKADDASAAENYAYDNLDKSWAMITNEEEHDPSFYPKGVVKTIDLTKKQRHL
jgi:hypothetical protein